MAESLLKSSGQLLMTMLAGSWRQDPTPFGCEASELEEIEPLLLNSGAAALCWRRLRHSGLQTTSAAKRLHQVYRQNTLQAALQQETIGKVVAHLRSAGIEPILVKGWAAARAYPEQGLRPCGDIDLCVSPRQFSAAETALKTLAHERYDVDLHCGFARLGGGSFDEIMARSHSDGIGQVLVRVPCAEDHLRILSIHMLREGAWRPLWLCDIAAAVESRPANFDWDCCLTKDRRRADWVTCAISLAHQLLGANVSDTPAAKRAKPLPGWLIPTILKEWESVLPSKAQRHRAPMAGFLRRPAGVWTGLRNRWPNPIEATIRMRGTFNDLPRLPFQIGNCLSRTVKFARRLPKALRQQ